MSDEAEFYTCADCGREMSSIGPNPKPGTCLMCQNVPGWHRNPELRRMMRMDDKLTSDDFKTHMAYFHHAHGFVCGALGRADVRAFLRERGITDAQMDAAKQALWVLVRRQE